MDSSIFELTHSLLQIGISVKNHNRKANSVDPHEMAYYELSHLDLHCLQRYLYLSVGTKGLKEKTKKLLYLANRNRKSTCI